MAIYMVQVRYRGEGSIVLFLMNPWLITLPGVVTYSDNVSCILNLVLQPCVSHTVRCSTVFSVPFAHSVCYESKIIIDSDAEIMPVELHHCTVI